jgi:transcriptional regulator
MYTPSHFSETRLPVLHELISANPFATLVINDAQGLNANHIPLLLSADGQHLQGHVARANTLWQSAPSECLVIFQGINGYISPNHYASKTEHGKVVPTWNYEVVQIKGTLQAIEDPIWLLALLNRLTNTHEQSQPKPWQVADAPLDYVSNLLKAIVGIEIHIAHIEGKFKLSQNQPPANKASLVARLQDRQMAAKITV